MRKLFWSCILCGVMLAGGVISTAYFAVHHPDSLIGRVLHGASHVAGIINPVVGLTPLRQAHAAVALAEEQSADAGDNEPWQVDPVPVPDDPIPVDDLNGKAPEPGPIVVTNGGSAPIVICEENNTGNPVPEYAPVDNGLPVPTGGTRPEIEECLSAASAAAPQIMPYCNDEDVYEILPMPAPVEDTQVLPMPRPVTDDDKNVSMGNEAIPCAGQPACGSKAPCGNIFRSLHRGLNMINGSPDDENGPEHPEIDTMEFRPSDLHLYDFGPSSL